MRIRMTLVTGIALITALTVGCAQLGEISSTIGLARGTVGLAQDVGLVSKGGQQNQSSQQVQASANWPRGERKTDLEGVLFHDEYENPDTINNYEIDARTAKIANGYLNLNGRTWIKKNLIKQELSDVTVECDIKSLVDNNEGIQGIYLRHHVDGRSYYFNWNDNPFPTSGRVEWQITKYGKGEDKEFSYLGRTQQPVYRVGNWIHLKAVAQGNRLELWVDQNDGYGLRRILAAEDGEYKSGDIGFRTGWVTGQNATYFDNLIVY